MFVWFADITLLNCDDDGVNAVNGDNENNNNHDDDDRQSPQHQSRAAALKPKISVLAKENSIFSQLSFFFFHTIFFYCFQIFIAI